MHVARALAVLDCRSRTEAVRKVADLGMLASRA
jgi:DNA-binding CsgD family transcriptional regulator